MSKQVMQQAADALWVLSEHDALHFGENHNTVVQGRAAIAELRAAIDAPEVEPVQYQYKSKTTGDWYPCLDEKHRKDTEADGTWEMRALYTAPPDPEALRRDAELGRVAMRFVDRAGDVHPGIDDAETICADFYKAMCAAIAAQGGGE